MNRKKILIYGFGRMGLTHFSILNGLNRNIQFTVVEPNRVLRNILKRNIKAEFYENDESLNESFDFSLITTPPALHKDLLKKCIKRGDKKIFVEKPFGGHRNIDASDLPNNIYIGYVLRFNSCIQWVRENIDPKSVKNIYGEYLSNTIEKKPSGWRNGEYSGVLNEMGSHVIDLVQYILGGASMALVSSSTQSVISDVDDIVNAELVTSDGINVSFYFNWVKKEIRKPIFSIQIELLNGMKYVIDQQQINIYDRSGEFLKKVSTTELIKPVDFYLRGTDFTSQMIDLLEDSNVLANVSDAIGVNCIMNNILNK